MWKYCMWVTRSKPSQGYKEGEWIGCQTIAIDSALPPPWFAISTPCWFQADHPLYVIKTPTARLRFIVHSPQRSSRAPSQGAGARFVTSPPMFHAERGTKSIHSWVESMAQSVSLARASRQPHHSSRYVVGPHQASERAPEPDRRGIQFGSFALNGPSVFG